MSDPMHGRRGRLILAAVLALVVLVALLTPERTQEGRVGDARLSSRLTGPQGARVLHDLARRLGWSVARRDTTALPAAVPGATIHAVLDPPEPLTTREAHELLDRVRGGDALLYVATEDRSVLNDSLGVRTAFGDAYQVPDSASRRCPTGHQGAVALWPDWRVHLYRVGWVRPPPAPLEVFARVRDLRGAIQPAAVGFALGRGRIAVVSDPDLLRNDVLRVCAWQADVVAVRMLEFLSARGDGAAPRRLVLFDEYHQGYGARPGTMRAVGMYLARTPSGHLVLQVMLAGLVWLLAAGPRALSPSDPDQVSRRSPLEHVRALAHAYGQVGATRTATARLVRGVRRRAARASGSAVSDDDFLAWVQRVAPARDADVALVRRALAAPHSKHELAAVGGALGRIESSLASLTR